MISRDEFIKEINHPVNGLMLICPSRDGSTSFQLVDEFGSGVSYAGAFYEVIDIEGVVYNGSLNAEGKGEVSSHYAGPVCLRFKTNYAGSNDYYSSLQKRDNYPLMITDLQVRAEQTRYVNHDSTRTTSNPAGEHADYFL